METNARSQDGAPTTFSASDALLWEALPHLQLNIAQTAALCGISVRQLGYWTKQGYVTASGRGARRLYGLEALRRVLAVRNAMNNGASLRQALKAQPEAPTPNGLTQASQTSMPMMPAPSSSGASPPYSLDSHEASALASDLVALFAANHDTRDDASGLAVKVGRSPSDIQSVAEALCAQGVLRKTYSHNSTVFQSARKDGL
jgi:DNA-binding transcriptional MerR regulator